MLSSCNRKIRQTDARQKRRTTALGLKDRVTLKERVTIQNQKIPSKEYWPFGMGKMWGHGVAFITCWKKKKKNGNRLPGPGENDEEDSQPIAESMREMELKVSLVYTDKGFLGAFRGKKKSSKITKRGHGREPATQCKGRT